MSTEGEDEPGSNNKRKRGALKGLKRDETKDKKFWYGLCVTYEELLKTSPKLKQTAFLRSAESGVDIDDSASNKQRFSTRYKQYRAGVLEPSDIKRSRAGKFENVAAKLIEDLDSRMRDYKGTRCGLSWNNVENKALEIARELGCVDFRASAGWLDTTLKRAGYMASNGDEDMQVGDFHEAMQKARKYAKSVGVEVKWLHQFDALSQEVIDPPSCKKIKGKKPDDRDSGNQLGGDYTVPVQESIPSGFDLGDYEI
jgi:hypothetical protein